MLVIVSMVILLSVILNNYCDTLLLILIFLVLLYLQCTILQYPVNVKIDTENSLLFLSLQHSRVGSIVQLCVRRNRCEGSLGPWPWGPQWLSAVKSKRGKEWVSLSRSTEFKSAKGKMQTCSLPEIISSHVGDGEWKS